MVDPAFAALMVGLTAQYPLGLVIYLDARRLGLRDGTADRPGRGS